MHKPPSIAFAKLSAAPKKGAIVILLSEDGAPAASVSPLDPAGTIARAAAAARFKGGFGTTLDVWAPEGTDLDRFALLGAGKPDKLDENGWMRLGGSAWPMVRKAENAAVILDLADGAPDEAAACAFALGLLLRSYAFDKYKSKKDAKGKAKEEDNGKPKLSKLTIHCADPAAAKKAFAEAEAVMGGVFLARDLVNEPANTLGPVEFAEKAKELEALGVAVEVLAEKEMRKLGMGALLGVAQGSPRGARLVVMQWNGGKGKDKPIAFVGKGVTFDTGGNSMKPASGMEDMKGDMGGAAAVTGLMHALASRKAKANVVGIIGLVENSVDGHAQRPGDIVTSMSGQTIEVLNTDAEGRLVLADALWYCNDRFQPRFMVNLATLTGAIMVALGQHHAGLFSNDDDLAGKLAAVGTATGEKLWRMPLGPEYDKLIDSKNADMKNIGGRYGGAIIAAQFLQRFVKETPWAHLDIAGTAMGSPASDTNTSWGSGFGVRLLDRLVRDHYEA
ncbi:MAG: leucyl aminopeptidase [Mesorhizobium sp.]